MRKRLAWVCLLALLCAAMFGCSANYNSARDSVSNGTGAARPQAVPAAESASPGGQLDIGELEGGKSAPNFGGHKIIRRFDYTIETSAFDQELAAMKDRANVVGGYVEYSAVSGKKPEAYNDPGRYASLTLRIPENAVDAFVAGVEQIKTVIYANSSSDDVSQSYFDLETRLSVLRTQRDNLKALLAKAEKLEDMLALETELSRVTIEIEELTTQIRSYDQLIAYATVTINFQEKALIQGPASDKSVGERIGEGITSVISGIGVFFENLLVTIVVISPVLGILAVIVIPVLVIVGSRNRKRRAAQTEERARLEEQSRNQE